MTVAGIRIEVRDAELKAAFDSVLDAGEDLMPLFDRIGASLDLSTQRRFETETDPQGRKWAPLSRRTIRQKKGDTRILRRTNRLYGSITHNATPTYLEQGTDVGYAPPMQFGAEIQHYARSQKATFKRNRKGQLRFASASTRAKSKTVRPITIGEHVVKIPAREFIGLSEADKQMILDETKAYLAERAGGAA